MVSIFGIRLSGGKGHEHIAEVRWRNPDTGDTGISDMAEMVQFIRGGGRAYVCGAEGWLALVEVVDTTPPHIRAAADGAWTDDLLRQRRF